MKATFLTKAVVALSLLAGALAPAHAFDTGHHADLTREALSEFGCNNTAIKIAQVENWLVDYYTNAPAASIHDLERLHFDNLRSPGQIRNYWCHLTDHTLKAIQKAAKDDQPLKVLALLGMSLHAVQDFYTHSNWVEVQGAGKAAYDMTTYFDSPNVGGLRTGRYPNADPVSDDDHGRYLGGMNHDAYGRPSWDRAYVYAYAASVQWVGAAKAWAEKARPGIWDKVQAITLSEKQNQALDFDREAAYRLSEWIVTPSGDNGHWKGWGSGSPLALSGFSKVWYDTENSIFLKHFTKDQWYKELTDGLQGTGDVGPALPTMPQFPLNRVAVRIRTTLVEELPVGATELRIDPGGSPDFFARVRVDGLTFYESMQLDKTKIQPFWMTIRFVPIVRGSIPIRYELFDEDGGDETDDLCDINPDVNKKHLDFVLDLKTGNLTGDLTGVHNNDSSAITVAGALPQKDRARVTLVISTRPLFR